MHAATWAQQAQQQEKNRFFERELHTGQFGEASITTTARFVLCSQVWGRRLLGPGGRLSSIRMIDPASHVLTNIENTPSSPAKKAKLSSSSAITAAAISTLRVKKLTPDATLPKRGSERAAGYDLARQDSLTF